LAAINNWFKVQNFWRWLPTVCFLKHFEEHFEALIQKINFETTPQPALSIEIVRQLGRLSNLQCILLAAELDLAYHRGEEYVLHFPESDDLILYE